MNDNRKSFKMTLAALTILGLLLLFYLLCPLPALSLS
jgi:hypothetical protein